MKRSIQYLLLIPILAASLGCSEETPQSVPDTQVSVGPTWDVVEQPLPNTIVVDGRVVAKRQAEIATRMMAHIASVQVDIGDTVHKGALLIQLGAEDVEASRESAEAGVHVARIAVAEARRQAERMDTLLAIDAVPLVQRDQAHLQLAAAEAQLVLAESGLKGAETATGYTTIIAPFAGTIVSRFADPGDMAAPGMPLLVIQDESNREGHFAIPASSKRYVSIGTPIEITAAGFDSIQSPVISISSGVDPSTGTVEIVTDLPASWIPGTTLTANVEVGTRDGIAVPESAVIRRGQLTGLQVVGSEGATIRWVRLGRRVSGLESDTPFIEVLSGLVAGERIVK